MVTSDFSLEVEIRPIGACARKICNVTLIYDQIAEIFAPIRKCGGSVCMCVCVCVCV